MAALPGLMLLAAAATSHPSANCYPYEPEVVSLTGTLARDQGATTTEAAGRGPHEYFELKLNTPICTVARKDDEWNLARRAVRKVQLERAADAALTDDKLSGALGKPVQCQCS